MSALTALGQLGSLAASARVRKEAAVDTGDDMANGYGLVTELANDSIERGSARAAGVPRTRGHHGATSATAPSAPSARMSRGTYTPGGCFASPGTQTAAGLATAAGSTATLSVAPARYHKAEYLEVLRGSAASTPEPGGVESCLHRGSEVSSAAGEPYRRRLG
jgi:hypothetical protein